MQYLADAWFFIALADRRDNHHARAVRLSAAISPRDIVTHDHVLAEVLAYVADEGALRRAAADAVRQTMRQCEVIAPDRPLFLAALDRYAARPDKEYSLVDCLSMVIMEQRGIQHVLTNDHHFTQAGFLIVNS